MYRCQQQRYTKQVTTGQYFLPKQERPPVWTQEACRPCCRSILAAYGNWGRGVFLSWPGVIQGYPPPPLKGTCYQRLTKWKHYLPRPSDAGGKCEQNKITPLNYVCILCSKLILNFPEQTLLHKKMKSKTPFEIYKEIYRSSEPCAITNSGNNIVVWWITTSIDDLNPLCTWNSIMISFIRLIRIMMQQNY